MASTTLPPRGPARPAGPAPPPPVGGRRQRRWSLAMVSVLVTLGSALAFVVLWMNAGDREPVLALRNDVAAGQAIEADDLTVVRVSADSGISPIPSSRRDEVLGQPAATNLLAGMLLVEGAVGTSHGLEPDSAVIAIPVPRTRMPTSDLRAGDRVVIVRTASSGPDEGTTSRQLGEGRVFEVEAGDDGASEIRVSVTVRATLAPEIGDAVQADEIYLFMAGG
ncbi:MAG TPA: SAF domain-containing protein [Acidimicrobiales bacterium]